MTRLSILVNFRRRIRLAQPEEFPLKKTWIAILVLLSTTSLAFADESCTYNGQSDYSGRLEAQTLVTHDGPTTTVRVLLRTHASFLFIPVDYYLDEISTWQNGELQKVGRNERYLAFHGIVRQIWDVFKRDGDKLAGYRVQGKTLDSLKALYPGWAPYWPVSTFGQPWMKDYDSAPPQRRPDLDLAPELTTPKIKTPLAMSFYWIRFLQPKAQTISIFVPGEERFKRIDLNLSAPQTQANGTQIWKVPFKAGPLKTPNDNPAKFWISADQKLLRADLILDHDLISAQGSLKLQQCQEW